MRDRVRAYGLLGRRVGIECGDILVGNGYGNGHRILCLMGGVGGDDAAAEGEAMHHPVGVWDLEVTGIGSGIPVALVRGAVDVSASLNVGSGGDPVLHGE